MKVINQIGHELLFTFSKLNPSYTQKDLEKFFLNNKRLSKLNYQFKDKSLLLKAFTHKSFSHESKLELENNERLEFLGDSVLSLIISEYIFKAYKDSKEGALSKLRSSIVNEDTLNDFALFLGLDFNIILGKGELKSEGYKKKSLLSDAFEALLGAIYLDSDFTTAREFLLNFIEEFESKKYKVFIKDAQSAVDDKTKLQEMVYQKYQAYPRYESEQVESSDKESSFRVALVINNKTIFTEINHSKKKAMQILAKKALTHIKEI